ncbi:hypothetical protein E2562_026563 [Oryza meyeriana var. granulata]|uniref:Leucine-rich repeat-containing N-terminal plant-type domain-containing protein n=1 Tax=Oryza meyeriana var. granulata TaxID=110450 RepID=A0A6G1CT70_9ORYZ|nr:hypothetical protein E2562_026563 [Oryza meyeriana var. granulata]
MGLDCCNWYGVTCNNKTGHIVKLVLTNYNINKEDGLTALGFGLGFSSVWWLLVFSKAVGKRYFQFVDSTCEKVIDWMILLEMKAMAAIPAY